MVLNEEELAHYNRHILLDEIGEEGQLKLKNAKVLVIGAGGLGCPVLQYLAAAGVGKIGVVDFDKVEQSNLQRQILFGYSDIGKNKTDAAIEKLKDLNPNVEYKPYPFKLKPDNVIELFNEYDLVVDGTDNFSARYLINDAALITNKPFVQGSIFKFEGQVSVFNYKNGPTYRCLFPELGKAPSCEEIGVIGILPGIIGTIAANEVLKIILGVGKILSGELLIFNALENQYSKIKFNKNEKVWGKYPKTESELLQMSYDDSSSSNDVIEIDVAEFKDKLKQGVNVIDVREIHEQPDPDFETIKMPLSSFLENLNKIDKDNEYVVMCQHGVRSLNALYYLREKEGFNMLTSLRGGIAAYYGIE